MPKKPLVIYLERQDSSRRLFPEDHDALIVALQKLQEDDVADVAIEAFNSTIAFDEQVARIARATVSISPFADTRSQGLNVFQIDPHRCSWERSHPLLVDDAYAKKCGLRISATDVYYCKSSFDLDFWPSRKRKLISRGLAQTDYSPLALAAGLQHYMVHEDK